jgi:hypothetical protein
MIKEEKGFDGMSADRDSALRLPFFAIHFFSIPMEVMKKICSQNSGCIFCLAIIKRFRKTGAMFRKCQIKKGLCFIHRNSSRRSFAAAEQFFAIKVTLSSSNIFPTPTMRIFASLFALLRKIASKDILNYQALSSRASAGKKHFCLG